MLKPLPYVVKHKLAYRRGWPRVLPHAGAHPARELTVCVRAEPVGNLRDVGYDVGRLWHEAAAWRFRQSVKAGECACPLASASSLLRVGRNGLRCATRPGAPGAR